MNLFIIIIRLLFIRILKIFILTLIEYLFRINILFVTREKEK